MRVRRSQYPDDSPRKGRSLRNNVFRTTGMASWPVSVTGWTIEHNTIEAGVGQAALVFYNATAVRVSCNRLIGGDWVLHLVDVQDAN